MLTMCSGRRSIPKARPQIAAPCPLWWCVLPRSPDTGWTKWASSAPESTSTRCTTPDLPPREYGKTAHSRLRTSLLRSFTVGCVCVFRLQHQVRKHNLVVASYDVVRNDIDFFRCVFSKTSISAGVFFVVVFFPKV